MVVAERLVAEAFGAAAAAFGEDVAALEMMGFGCDFGHGSPPAFELKSGEDWR
jgi:hypothetical protein